MNPIYPSPRFKIINSYSILFHPHFQLFSYLFIWKLTQTSYYFKHVPYASSKTTT